MKHRSFLAALALLQQIVRYYNQPGIRTTVHVSSELRALDAIYAGVDTLAHPVIQGPVSDSFVKLTTRASCRWQAAAEAPVHRDLK